MRNKKEYLLLAGIMLLGIVARMIKFNDPVIIMDSAAFMRLGKNLVESGRYAFGENYNLGVFFPPGYPFFIGIFNLILRDLFLSAKLVSFISSCITIFTAYLIGKELYDSEAGLFAAAVFAFYPVVLILSVDGLSDTLFFCLLFLSIYLFIVSTKQGQSVRMYTSLGGMFAVTYLTRPEGIFLFLLPLLHITGMLGDKPPINRKYLLRVASMVTVFILVVSPYMMFIKNYTGKFSLSGKGNNAILLGELGGDRNFHEIINAPDNPYDRAAFTLTEDKTQLRGWNRNENLSFREYLLKDFRGFIRRYIKNVRQEAGILMKLFLPVLLPLFFCFFDRDLFRNRMRLIFLLFPLIYFLMYPVFIIIERQTLIIVLFLVFFCCSGFSLAPSAIASLVNYYGLKKGGFLRFMEGGIQSLIIILLLLGSLTYLKYSSFDDIPDPVEHRIAGKYLKETLSPGYEELNIMGRKPYVSFFSDSRFTMLPYADSDDVVYFAKLNSVDYIVIDERFLSKWEYYDELMEMHEHSEDVELFYEGGSENLIRLFRLKR
jgi:4-amino-4-deoxy-L-arabinose transferase-like glycosyltransferase